MNHKEDLEEDLRLYKNNKKIMVNNLLESSLQLNPRDNLYLAILFLQMMELVKIHPPSRHQGHIVERLRYQSKIFSRLELCV